MPTIEFIYDADCPNIDAARNNLLAALKTTGHRSHWQEWDRAAHDSPAHIQGYGSPTLLINGRDVADVAPTAEANCCRVYKRPDGGLSGVPAIDTIIAALRVSKEQEQ